MAHHMNILEFLGAIVIAIIIYIIFVFIVEHLMNPDEDEQLFVYLFVAILLYIVTFLLWLSGTISPLILL